MTTAGARRPSNDYPARMTRITLIWVVVGLVLFPVLAILGLVMRYASGRLFRRDAAGMVLCRDDAARPRHGRCVVRGRPRRRCASCSRRTSAPGIAVSRIALGMTLLGVVLLLAATLIGKLGVGRDFLYPLPFHLGGHSAAVGYCGALFGAGGARRGGWMLWAGDLLRAIAVRYRLSEALGWHVARRPFRKTGRATSRHHRDGELHRRAGRTRGRRRDPAAGGVRGDRRRLRRTMRS